MLRDARISTEDQERKETNANPSLIDDRIAVDLSFKQRATPVVIRETPSAFGRTTVGNSIITTTSHKILSSIQSPIAHRGLQNLAPSDGALGRGLPSRYEVFRGIIALFIRVCPTMIMRMTHAEPFLLGLDHQQRLVLHDDMGHISVSARIVHENHRNIETLNI